MGSFILTVPPACIKSKAVHSLVWRHTAGFSSLYSYAKVRKAMQDAENIDVSQSTTCDSSRSPLLPDPRRGTRHTKDFWKTNRPPGVFLCRDPPAWKIGSGGGTVHALFYLYDYYHPPHGTFTRRKWGGKPSFISLSPCSSTSPSWPRSRYTVQRIHDASAVRAFLSWCTSSSSEWTRLESRKNDVEGNRNERMRKLPQTSIPTRSSTSTSNTCDTASRSTPLLPCCSDSNMTTTISLSTPPVSPQEVHHAPCVSPKDRADEWWLPLMVLHAGGCSQRLPAWSARGKWSIPVPQAPTMEPTLSPPPSSSLVLTHQFHFLWHQLWTSLPRQLQSHMVVMVACGDVVLRVPSLTSLSQCLAEQLRGVPSITKDSVYLSKTEEAARSSFSPTTSTFSIQELPDVICFGLETEWSEIDRRNSTESTDAMSNTPIKATAERDERSRPSTCTAFSTTFSSSCPGTGVLSRHGVFVLHPSSTAAPTGAMALLQKPNDATLQWWRYHTPFSSESSTNMVPNQFLLDVGVWLLSKKAVAVLAKQTITIQKKGFHSTNATLRPSSFSSLAGPASPEEEDTATEVQWKCCDLFTSLLPLETFFPTFPSSSTSGPSGVRVMVVPLPAGSTFQHLGTTADAVRDPRSVMPTPEPLLPEREEEKTNPKRMEGKEMTKENDETRKHCNRDACLRGSSASFMEKPKSPPTWYGFSDVPPLLYACHMLPYAVDTCSSSLSSSSSSTSSSRVLLHENVKTNSFWKQLQQCWWRRGRLQGNTHQTVELFPVPANTVAPSLRSHASPLPAPHSVALPCTRNTTADAVVSSPASFPLRFTMTHSHVWTGVPPFLDVHTTHSRWVHLLRSPSSSPLVFSLPPYTCVEVLPLQLPLSFFSTSSSSFSGMTHERRPAWGLRVYLFSTETETKQSMRSTMDGEDRNDTCDVSERGASLVSSCSTPTMPTHEKTENPASTVDECTGPSRRMASTTRSSCFLSGGSLSQWLSERRLTWEMIFPDGEVSGAPCHGSGETTASLPSTMSMDMWEAKLFPCVYPSWRTPRTSNSSSREWPTASDVLRCGRLATINAASSSSLLPNEREHRTSPMTTSSAPELYEEASSFSCRTANETEMTEEEGVECETAIQQLGDWLVWMTCGTPYAASSSTTPPVLLEWKAWWEATRTTFITVPRVSAKDLQEFADIDAAVYFENVMEAWLPHLPQQRRDQSREQQEEKGHPSLSPLDGTPLVPLPDAAASSVCSVSQRKPGKDGAKIREWMRTCLRYARWCVSMAAMWKKREGKPVGHREEDGPAQLLHTTRSPSSGLEATSSHTLEGSWAMRTTETPLPWYVLHDAIQEQEKFLASSRSCLPSSWVLLVLTKEGPLSLPSPAPYLTSSCLGMPQEDIKCAEVEKAPEETLEEEEEKVFDKEEPLFTPVEEKEDERSLSTASSWWTWENVSKTTRMAEVFHQCGMAHFQNMALHVFRNILVLPYLLQSPSYLGWVAKEAIPLSGPSSAGTLSSSSSFLVSGEDTADVVSPKRYRGVRVFAPVRVDLAGGWTDFPAYCFGRDGNDEKEGKKEKKEISRRSGEPRAPKEEKRERSIEETGPPQRSLGEVLNMSITFPCTSSSSSSASYPIVVEVYRLRAPYKDTTPPRGEHHATISFSSSSVAPPRRRAPCIRLRSWEGAHHLPLQISPISTAIDAAANKNKTTDAWGERIVSSFEEMIRVVHPSLSCDPPTPCSRSFCASPFSIPILALLLLGWGPPLVSSSSSTATPTFPFRTLQDLLFHSLHGDSLGIDMRVCLPTGSGLGTSSALAAAVLYAIRKFMKYETYPSLLHPSSGEGASDVHEPIPPAAAGASFCSGVYSTTEHQEQPTMDEYEERQECARQTIVLEQLLGTGGGWQDAFGAIFPGVKHLTCFGHGPWPVELEHQKNQNEKEKEGSNSPSSASSSMHSSSPPFFDGRTPCDSSIPSWPYFGIHLHYLESRAPPRWKETQQKSEEVEREAIKPTATHRFPTLFHASSVSSDGDQFCLSSPLPPPVCATTTIPVGKEEQRGEEELYSTETIGNDSIASPSSSSSSFSDSNSLSFATSKSPDASVSLPWVFTHPSLAPLHLLYFTGMTRQGEDITRGVAASILLRDPPVMEALHTIHYTLVPKLRKVLELPLPSSFDVAMSEGCSSFSCRGPVDVKEVQKERYEKVHRMKGPFQKENEGRQGRDEKEESAYIRSVLQQYGKLIYQSQLLNHRLDPLRARGGTSSASFLQKLFQVIAPYVYGAKFCGAGGGGFVYMVAKDVDAVQALHNLLTPFFPLTSHGEASSPCNRREVEAKNHQKEVAKSWKPEFCNAECITTLEKFSVAKKEYSPVTDANGEMTSSSSFSDASSLQYPEEDTMDCFSPHPKAFFMPFRISTDEGLSFEVLYEVEKKEEKEDK